MELGYPVANWFPVDVDEDGTWELAITVAGTPLRIGVFDPQRASWMDGPRAVPPPIRAWSTDDYNRDGYVEYAYLQGDTTHLLYPARGIDTALAVLPLTGDHLTIWGETSAGHPIVAISRQVVSNTSSLYTVIYWEVNVFDLTSGQKLPGVLGGPDGCRIVYGCPSSTATSLALYQEEARFDDTPWMGSRCYRERIVLLGRDWSTLETLWISDMKDYSGPHVCRWVDWFTPGRFEQDGLTHFLTCLTSIGTLPQTMYSHHSGNTHWDWATSPPWDNNATFAFDLDGNGATLWIEPLRGGVGWRRRDFTTGSIVDTLRGMPSVPSPLTGALFTPGVSDLFYVRDSGLYVWVPGVYAPASIQEDQRQLTPGVGTALTAAPNPFNAAVRLSWSEATEPSGLEIFNILGQKVRAYHLDAGSYVSGAVWDGTDASGRSVPSGMYFARLVAHDRSATIKILLLK